MRITSPSPTVSVLLPVHNGEDYLYEAIQSVIGQTFEDFELVVVDDGSTDSSGGIARQFKDRRIRVFNQMNEGLPAALNRSIRLSRGKYLARQDHDDLSMPNRLKKQVEFLEARPDHGMVGAWAAIWEGNISSARVHRHPASNLAAKFELLFNNPFVHSSVMIRKTALDTVGLYSTDPARQPPEDYELWSRIGRRFAVANIPEILSIYREIPQSFSRFGRNPFPRLIDISVENVMWHLGQTTPNQHIVDLSALVNGAFLRLSPNPDLRNVLATLLSATRNLAANANKPSRLLAYRVGRTILSILRSYCRYRRFPKGGSESKR